MPTARRISLALKSLDIAADALDKLPDSQEKSDLLDLAHACRQAVEGWRRQPPTVEERERMMDRLLKLHVAVAKLGRRP